MKGSTGTVEKDEGGERREGEREKKGGEQKEECTVTGILARRLVISKNH